MQLRFDLQSHSTYSDGELAPAAVVAAAAEAGIELLALTDHDSVSGVAEARRAAAQRRHLRLVDAVEMSVHDPAAADLHLCGYLIDIENPQLLRTLDRSRDDRRSRAGKMAQALESLGFVVDRDQLDARAARGETIGRPNLAGAVVGHPANHDRLSAAGLLNPSAFLEAYLIDGKPAFRPREAPTIEDAIALIHQAGGVAAWAHPFWDLSDPTDVQCALERFVAAGLDGVEVFYHTHTREQTEFAFALCAEFDLLTTGSGDFHGPNHRKFNRFGGFETYGLRPDLGVIAGR